LEEKAVDSKRKTQNVAGWGTDVTGASGDLGNGQKESGNRPRRSLVYRGGKIMSGTRIGPQGGPPAKAAKKEDQARVLLYAQVPNGVQEKTERKVLVKRG